MLSVQLAILVQGTVYCDETSHRLRSLAVRTTSRVHWTSHWPPLRPVVCLHAPQSGDDGEGDGDGDRGPSSPIYLQDRVANRPSWVCPKTSVPYHRDGVTRCWSSTVSRTVRGKYCAGGADHHPPHLSDQSRCPLLNAGSQNFDAAPQGMQARGSGDGSATVVATAVLVRMRCATRRNGRDFYWNLFRYYTCSMVNAGGGERSNRIIRKKL